MLLSKLSKKSARIVISGDKGGLLEAADGGKERILNFARQSEGLFELIDHQQESLALFAIEKRLSRPCPIRTS